VTSDAAYHCTAATERPKGGRVASTHGTDHGTKSGKYHAIDQANLEEQRAEEAQQQVVGGDVGREPDDAHLGVICKDGLTLTKSLGHAVDAADFKAQRKFETEDVVQHAFALGDALRRPMLQVGGRGADHALRSRGLRGMVFRSLRLLRNSSIGACWVHGVENGALHRMMMGRLEKTKQPFFSELESISHFAFNSCTT
jgi:hypothetical protein